MTRSLEWGEDAANMMPDKKPSCRASGPSAEIRRATQACTFIADIATIKDPATP